MNGNALEGHLFYIGIIQTDEDYDDKGASLVRYRSQPGTLRTSNQGDQVLQQGGNRSHNYIK